MLREPDPVKVTRDWRTRAELVRRAQRSSSIASSSGRAGSKNGSPGNLVGRRQRLVFAGWVPDGRVWAWTIIDESDSGPIYEGDHAYKEWITGPAAESHRAYPGIHVDIGTPIVNTFMVYLEADYAEMASEEWDAGVNVEIP